MKILFGLLAAMLGIVIFGLLLPMMISMSITTWRQAACQMTGRTQSYCFDVAQGMNTWLEQEWPQR